MPRADTNRRILAALYHSYIDTSSGAAISLRDMLEALARREFVDQSWKCCA